MQLVPRDRLNCGQVIGVIDDVGQRELPPALELVLLARVPPSFENAANKVLVDADAVFEHVTRKLVPLAQGI